MEGVVHALRRIHRSVVPDGILLDVHPVPPDAFAESGGRRLGTFDGSAFFEIVRATEAHLDETAQDGLWELEAATSFDWVEQAEDGAGALEIVREWGDYAIPAALERALQAIDEPVRTHENAVVRRFRRL